MALPHNTNDSLARIIESNNQANNPTVNGVIVRRTDIDRGANETLSDYNLRVAPGVQPVQPKATKTYLGGTL